MKRFYSVSSHPGTFGKTIYTHLFKELGIDATYEPLQLDRNGSLYETIWKAVLNGDGLSVSMPFKKTARLLCDCLNSRVLPNVNTMKYNHQTEEVEGYNTDMIGFERACAGILSDVESATIVGTGALSDSIYAILKMHNIKNVVIHSSHVPYDADGSRDLLINASPIGMPHVNDLFFHGWIVRRHSYVFDAVVSRSTTHLKYLCGDEMKPYIPGCRMAAHQLAAQFKIYTGQDAPMEAIRTKMAEMRYELQ